MFNRFFFYVGDERPTLKVQEQSVTKYRGVVGIDKLLRWSFFVKSVNCFSGVLFSKKAPS